MNPTRSSNILITGASGLIGSALSEHLTSMGYSVHRLSRRSEAAPFYYQEDAARVVLDPTVELAGVINLAGPSIADRRWSESRKLYILQSRQRLTHALAVALAESATPPRILLSASAIGFYGATGTAPVDENAAAGTNFLAQVAQAWEAATAPAEAAGINTIHLRFGIVLSVKGGVLQKLLLPFKLGLGGRLGDGQQCMSWISIEDAVQIIRKLLEDNPRCGPLNLVAGQPVTNADFSKHLGHALHRPSLLPLPAFMVRLLFGEMGEALLLGSSRVTSCKLASLGIRMQHPAIDSALTAQLNL